ncbi:type IV pilus assembly protein PilM [Rathayibacter sp. YIM 133350]|uniref:type IV pilus assembly protein PilM n=1 Tax=Rathayibacter sp. YIM 133350 TaxID=3131992 RepID=UPI00307CFAE5
MAKSVVGIDIGNGSIRAVEVSDPTKPRPTVLRYGEIAISAEAASRGEIVEHNNVGAALKSLWSKSGFRSKNVVLGMGNHRVLARDLSIRKMPLKSIREALPFEVQDILPIPVADALLDFYPVSESIGEQGPMVNGLLIAAVKEAVLGNVKATQVAGLTALDVDLIPFALSRVLLPRNRSHDTVALIDLGADTTTVVVCRSGVPQFVRIIPAGGNTITEALSVGLEINPQEAETIKRDLGLAFSISTMEEKAAVDIIYRVASEQLTSLRNTIVYYASTRPSDPISGIMLTGGGSLLKGFSAALSDMTKLPVMVQDAFTNVTMSRSVDEGALRAQSLRYSVALGLAMGSAA